MRGPAFFCLFVAAGWPVSILLSQSDSSHVEQWPSAGKSAVLIGSPVASRSEILRTLAWQWTPLGPHQQPEERNPGGKAIPAYAAGRGNGTGRINYLFMHPEQSGYLWACSPTGGVWRTTDEGATWTGGGTDQLEISGVSSIAVDRRNTDHWVIATGDGDDVFMFTDGVWITRDGGKTYKDINGRHEGYRLPFGERGDFYGQIGEIGSAPNRLRKLFVASNRGLWVSSGRLTSYGVTWTKAADGLFYDILYISGKRRRDDIVAAAGDRLVISFDGGRTWEQMPSPEYPDASRFKFLRISLAHSPEDPENIYAAVTCSESNTQSPIGEGTLQVFNLDSRTWSLVRSLRSGMNNVIPTRARAFAISPENPDILFCGNVQPLYRSADRGDTFSRIEKNQMHDDCHHILIAPDGKTVWAAHDGGVSRSTDGGIHFEARDQGISAANVFGVSVAQSADPQVAYGGYDTGGNLLRDGKWWHVSWGDGFETITHPYDRDIVFTTMQNGTIQRSLNGIDFEDQVSPSGARTEWHTWIRMHPVVHDHLYVAGARLMRSVDLGESWEQLIEVNELDSTLVNAYKFFLSPDHPGVMYVYMLDKTLIRPQVWRTFNITGDRPSSIQWEKVADLPMEGWISGISVDPDDPRRFWLLYSRTEEFGKLWYFNGSTYSDETANLGLSKCESMVLQKGPEKRLYIGSSYGVFTRRQGESQWTLLTGLPGTCIKSLDINYTAGKLVAGTFGRGIWWGDLVRR